MNDFARDGITILGGVVPNSTVAQLQSLQEFLSGNRPGRRSFTMPLPVAELIGPHGSLTEVATLLMRERVQAVRALYFDKTPGMNWGVPWHQDRTIAVARRADVPGFGPWSLKAGIHHVEPPEDVLQRMISVRLHVDDCDPTNGPLLTLRGSFRLGRVPARQIRGHVQRGAVQTCCAKAGDVVAMRGLTIHASESASRPQHRRVLHVDFSAATLPNGLEWALA